MPDGEHLMAEIIVIGAGPAGLRCAETLARGGQQVRVLGAEPGLPYNRVALSNYLAGDVDEAGLITFDAKRLSSLGIDFRAGERVTGIDRERRTLRTESDETLEYDKLVLATGSQAVRLPLPGADLPGVLLYRTLDEVNTMIATARNGGRALVIGGGLLGLEAAVGLRRRGMNVTVLHAVDRLMERQLDNQAGALLAERLRGQGIAVELGAGSVAIAGDTRAEAVVLKDGRQIPADLVVMAVGIRPEASLARQAGLAVGRGIVVDDRMLTSDAAIYAVGECAEHNGVCCGLVAPAFAQAEVAARNMLGQAAAYLPATDATSLKVAGAGVWSGGDISADDAEMLTYFDAAGPHYRCILLRDRKLAGAVLYGETSDAAWYKSLLGEDVAAMRETIAFGRAFGDSGLAA
jgi:nitrite reductase (NADH) large subunit